MEIYETDEIRTHAGDFMMVKRIRKWLLTETLDLESVAASALASDLRRLESWMPGKIILHPFGLPEGYVSPETLQWPHREVLRAVMGFRALALSQLTQKWRESLPAVPLTVNETKKLVMGQVGQGGKVAFDLLRDLDSESATLIRKLNITREVMREALSELRGVHAEQINLLRIACGARFKFFFQGILTPTCSPNAYWGRPCGAEDSFEHLLKCYSFRGMDSAGPELLTFLITLARRTVTSGSGRPKPKSLEVAKSGKRKVATEQ